MQILRKFFIRFLVILLAIQGALVAQVAFSKSTYAAGNPEVVINEIMWMGGSAAHTGDEWIELYNTTDSAIDISGWVLTHAATSNADLVVPAGNTIAAHEYFLISNYDESNANTVLDVQPDWVTTSIALSDNCPVGGIVLKNSLSVVVDAMGCDGSNYLAGSNTATKVAMERNLVIGDGTATGLDNNWHNSMGFVNLDAGVNVLATPKFINDITKPVIGTVSDEGQFTANTAELYASWTGFDDPESGLTTYNVGVGTAPGVSDIQFVQDIGLVGEYTFTGLSLNENGTYYVNVIAVNGVSLVSLYATTDGITVNTVDPATPADLTVSDTPNDNGGSLTATWSASTSPDVDSYQVNYRKTGDAGWNNLNVGSSVMTVITNLENSPASYEVTVEAIDFNDQHSAPSSIVSAQARDDLAPILNVNNVVVNQNKPGTDDAIVGLTGAVNEQGSSVYVFDRDPSLTGPVIINSEMMNVDGSFAAMGIGDNRYAQVWVQLVDASGNASVARMFTNDIVGPVTPSLTQVNANCVGDPCRVMLSWTNNAGADVAYYKVSYTALNGVEQLTMALTGTQAALDLKANETYEFKLFAFDQYGNQSSVSNAMSARLTVGVNTVVAWVNGQAVTTTTAISGAVETRRATVSSAIRSYIAPTAKAAEPTTDNNQAPTTPEQKASEADSQDWVRILVVVALLLVIAGSIYALARSMNGPTQNAKPKTTKRSNGRRPTKKGRARK